MKRSLGAHWISPFGITQLVMLLVVGAALWMAYDPWRWGKLRDLIREKYPDTSHIDGRDLAAWLAGPLELRPLLIDVRTPAEFEASHLPSAQNFSLSDIPAKLGTSGQVDQAIVIYCAVGYDSADAASGLLRRGYKRVQYLDGGIFLWANDEHPLIGPKGIVKQIRPGASSHTNLLRSQFIAR